MLTDTSELTSGTFDDEEMPKKRASETFRKMVGVRLSEDDYERLKALAERVPIATQHAIAREAMRIGIAVLEEDPMRLVTAPPKEPRAKAKTRTRNGRVK